MLGDAMGELLRLIDVLQLNLAQAQDCFGATDVERAADAALDAGVDSVVITLGAAGCFVATADERRRMPAIAADVVGTTGCGDTFAAGLVWGVPSGASLPDAGRFGLAAAALNIEALGACHAVSGPRRFTPALGRQAITPTT